jgi:hypothetical protein
MILDLTTDALEIILDKAITTSQLSFTVFYNEYTSTTITPMSNYGTTNSTTAVNLIPPPTSGKQRQLKYCSINNVDTKDIGVKIRFNNNGSFTNLLYIYLGINESIQYSEEAGWRVYDANGGEKVNAYYRMPGTIRLAEGFGAANASTTLSLTNTNCFCVYLGTAERPYSSVKLQYGVTTQITANISWAELAIYKGTPTINANTSMTRLGFTDTSAVWNTTGNKTTTVSVSDMAVGDDLWAVFSNSTDGTVASLRAGVVDDLGTGFFQTVTNTRPSTNSSITGTISSTVAQIWVAWQGVYQGT